MENGLKPLTGYRAGLMAARQKDARATAKRERRLAAIYAAAANLNAQLPAALYTTFGQNAANPFFKGLA